jgi:DNA topoisomerase III
MPMQILRKRIVAYGAKLLLQVLLLLVTTKLARSAEESKPSSQAAPQLFDLTSLQREANARFGFSAKNTLGLAQALV